MTPISISDAVARLKKEGIKISRQRIYQHIYAGKISYLQKKDFGGSGRSRTGGRILIDWTEVAGMYEFHPREKND